MNKYIAIAAAIFSLSKVAQADLLTQCNAWAGEVNKSAPQVIDKVTTLLNSLCIQDGSIVTLLYRNKLNVPAGSVDQTRLNTIRSQMVTAWCTDPVQRATLSQVNIQYIYVDLSGKFIGKLDVGAKDCRL